MNPYKGIDLLDLDSQYTDDELQVRATVRRWVEFEAMPEVVPAFNEARFPADLIPGLAAIGVFGAHLEGPGAEVLHAREAVFRADGVLVRAGSGRRMHLGGVRGGAFFAGGGSSGAGDGRAEEEQGEHDGGGDAGQDDVTSFHVDV